MSTTRLIPAVLGLAALHAIALPAPPARAAEVKIEADLGQSVVNRRASDRVYLRLVVEEPRREGPRAPLADQRRDRHRPLGLDAGRPHRGGEGRRAHAALERLSKDDIVSLVAYNHNVDVLVPAARFGGTRDELERAIDRLRADGTTALYDGVKEGGRQLKEFLSDTKVNRVVLLSDGLANVGPSTRRASWPSSAATSRRRASPFRRSASASSTTRT